MIPDVRILRRWSSADLAGQMFESRMSLAP
jgi:hypothetical protein